VNYSFIDKWLLIFIAATMVLFIVGPLIYTNQLFFFTLMIYTILALAFNVIYGYTGYLPFGYTAFFGMGAYGFAIGIHLGIGIFPSILLAVAITVLLALLFSPMFRLRGAYFAIANLAGFEAVYYIIENNYMRPITGGPYGVSIPQVFNPTLTYYIALAMLALIILINGYLEKSDLGLALRAIGNNPVTAYLAGINVPLTRNIAWLISAAFAGVAGALYGWYIAFFYPESVLSLTASLFIIAFTIFGGAGTLMGPVIGTWLLYSVYDTIGISYPTYFTLIYGLLIVIFILVLPNGLVKLIEKYLKIKIR